MPPTQIPIDGLWRCLCPAIDGIAIKRFPRFVARNDLYTYGSDPRPSRSRSFHSSSQNRAEQRTTESPRTEPTIPLYQTTLNLRFPRPSWSNRVPAVQRKHRASIKHELDAISTAQIHDTLRKIRTERRSYLKVADYVDYLISVRGEKPALIHYESLIRANASAKHGSVATVRTLLYEMKSSGILADSGIYHGALQVLAIHPDYVLRAELLQEMKERWIGLSPEGWHSLVIGLIRDRQYEFAMDKLEEMQSDEIRVQPWLYDIFMFQLCEAGELDEAFNLLKNRFEKGRSEILPTVWYYLLDVFTNAFHYEGTKYIWKRRVETESLVLSDGMCIAALNLAARNSDPELATSTIRILSGRRSALTAFHYEALLAAYAGARDLSTAFRVLTIMTKAGLETDASTTRPLFQILTQSKEFPYKGWAELEELVHDGHAIPVAAANVVIEAAVQVGHFEQAVELYKSLHNICPSGPNTDTFNVLLQGAARQERKDLSMFLAGEMQALGIKPDHLTYDRLILACLRQDDYEDAFNYLEEMVEVGADQPHGGWWMRGGTVRAMIEKCVLNTDDRAWDLLEEMEKRGMKGFDLKDWAEQHWKGPKRSPDLRDRLSAWATE